MTPELRQRVQAVGGATALESRRDGFWMVAPEVDVTNLATIMRDLEGRLSTVTAVGCRDGEVELIYHYVVDGDAINVKTRTKGKAIASIAPVTKAANWIEREIRDLCGVWFEGHPEPERLVRPVQLEEGFFLRD